MPKVLVTGAGGYIGTVPVPALLERGYEVRALDRFFFGKHLLNVDSRIKM
jgi:nucleoside-diphosphate-sugar epimerase